VRRLPEVGGHEKGEGCSDELDGGWWGQGGREGGVELPSSPSGRLKLEICLTTIFPFEDQEAKRERRWVRKVT